MQKAAEFLLSKFDANELPAKDDVSPVYRAGLHALCVYALLTAGQSLPDERLSIKGEAMAGLIEAMKAHELTPLLEKNQEPVTYARSLRAAALSLHNRKEDRQALKDDVAWLVAAEVDGGYTYDDRYGNSESPAAPSYQFRKQDVPWDNSNSQYGLLGVWSGAEVGMEVPDRYWKDVERHWTTTQLKDGQWHYSDAQPHKSMAMVCAGVASLYVTHDYLDAPLVKGSVGRDPFPGALGRGLAALEQGNVSVETPNTSTFFLGYDLYSLERVGLASGLKFMGSHDWYRELAEKVLRFQRPDGAFPSQKGEDAVITETAYTLLFLARGRQPIFLGKLRFEKYWANRPRDAANLTRFASRELERPLNWQVVSIDRPWHDWLDSPVLFIASHQPPQLTAEDYGKLRDFVRAGGLIFTHADAGSEAFSAWVPQLVKNVCGDYELQTLADSHPLYSINYHIAAPRPKLQGVSNGSRLLLVHSPADLASAWQGRNDKMFADRFRLAINIVLYASGKADLRNRLNTPYVPESDRPPVPSIAVARLQYPGNWDPEPYAWKRLGNLLTAQSGEGLFVKPVLMNDLKPGDAPLAHLTGTAAYAFTPDQIAALKAYVNSGGVLLIDDCGGDNAFARSVRSQLLPQAFAGDAQPIPLDHPLFAGLTPGKANASPLRLRPYAADKLGRAAPSVAWLRSGAGYVIFTPLDLTSGLLGTNTWGIVGYDHASCERFVRNLVEWVKQTK